MRNTAARRLRAFVVTTVALAALAVLASGCGALAMGQHHQQMYGGGGGAPQTPVVSDASQVSVEIANYDFSPRDLTVSAGTAITWTNSDSAPHDATDQAGEWGTGFLSQGESATVAFESPGVYEYICTIHPNMRATLTVDAEL